MSQDVVRHEEKEFGKDLGLVHEMVVTGRKVGANKAFYATLTENTSLFRLIVDIVRGEGDKDLLFPEASEALRAAVKIGVKFEHGYYRFFDPGIPFVVQRNLLVIRQRKLFHDMDCLFGSRPYSDYDWAVTEDEPKERLLCVPVKNSFEKDLNTQRKLLLPNEAVPPVRRVVMLLVIDELSGKPILPKELWVRCEGGLAAGRFACDTHPVSVGLDRGRASETGGLAAEVLNHRA